jgi:hypothetical protein
LRDETSLIAPIETDYPKRNGSPFMSCRHDRDT